MKIIAASLVLASLMFLTHNTRADEIPKWSVGSSYTMQCTGPYYSTDKQTLTSYENGVSRWEIERDGKAMWREKPDGMLGSHIHVRRNSNDDKGIRKWEWEANTDEYDPLTPGSTLSVTATQRNNKWTAREKEFIRVEERKTITAPILGEVDAIRVTNQRKMTAQLNKWTYESSFEIWVDTATGAPIKYSYKDNKGTNECVLSELDLK